VIHYVFATITPLGLIIGSLVAASPDPGASTSGIVGRQEPQATALAADQSLPKG